MKLRQYYDHPLLVEMFADGIAAAAATLPDAAPRLVFTAHSIPVQARFKCGKNLYERQVAHAAALVAAAARDMPTMTRCGSRDRDRRRCPWLEPDVCDHLTKLAAGGTEAVIVCPVGFVADHIEVVWDLDHELRQQAQARAWRLPGHRRPTPTGVSRGWPWTWSTKCGDGREPVRVSAANPPPL